MAFTDDCGLYGALHEDGINRVAEHLMRQRPALFNYGTEDVAGDPDLWCRPIEAAEDVEKFDNPLMTVEPPLPVLGTNYAVDFCLQIAAARIDFHPGTITLPDELDPPLAEQRFAGLVTVCAGLGCPPEKVVDGKSNKRVPPPRTERDKKKEREEPPKPPRTIVLPTDEMHCFCIDGVAVGHVVRKGNDLGARLDGFEIVDITPAGLEDSIECYITLLIKLALIPKLRVALETIVLNIPFVGGLSFSATPAPGIVPHNPAIEDDQVKAFIDVAVTP